MTEITDGLQENDDVMLAVFNASSGSKAATNPFMPAGRPASGGGRQGGGGAH
jgi:hypothetical protein